MSARRRVWALAGVAGLAAVSGCSDTATPLELAGAPAAVVPMIGGSAVVGGIGDTLAAPMRVKVTDATGKPVPAVAVHWQAARGAFLVVHDSTDLDGMSAVRWVLPAVPGADTLTATVTGVGSARFTATVQPMRGTIVYRFVDAGSHHACGITTTEEMLCWGYNGDGQLGLAPSASVPYPTLIERDARYRAVTGGQFHACALTLAQVAWCWGNNQDGRLGTAGGSGSISATPVAVSTQAIFQVLQAGRVHSCGIDLAQNGWCWGYNGEGELGRGPVGPGSSGPPDVVNVGTPLEAIAVGGLHTCAITAAGQGFCWGYNAQGQLGNGGTTTTGTPTLVSGGLTFQGDPLVVFPSPDPDFPLPVGPYIAAGQSHTCAIASSGTTYCWGLNEHGQLGDGTSTQRTSPTAVTGPQFVAVTAGVRHTCGLTSAGVAYCWGDNTHGQLGDGATTGRLAPTAVAGNLAFAYLKAGDLFTCGITSAGVAYCWGDNEYGQLGDGTKTSHTSPAKVAFQQ